jgi:hypothetical protein
MVTARQVPAHSGRAEHLSWAGRFGPVGRHTVTVSSAFTRSAPLVGATETYDRAVDIVDMPCPAPAADSPALGPRLLQPRVGSYRHVRHESDCRSAGVHRGGRISGVYGRGRPEATYPGDEPTAVGDRAGASACDTACAKRRRPSSGAGTQSASPEGYRHIQLLARQGPERVGTLLTQRPQSHAHIAGSQRPSVGLGRTDRSPRTACPDPGLGTCNIGVLSRRARVACVGGPGLLRVASN